ncbi:MAG: hypothetical protein ACTHK6_08795 [Solirubrobacterales bacterium]
MNLRKRKEKKELATAIERGRFLISAREEKEAYDFLSKAVESFPRDPEIRLLHATILLAFRPGDVAAEAAKAVELGPDDPLILVRAGHLLLGRGDRASARSCAVRATELSKPDFFLMPSLMHLNGSLAALDGEDEVAEENLRSAIASEPNREPWVRHLAVFLAERGRLQEGAEVLDEALNHVKKKDEIERMRDRMMAEAGDS